MKTLDKFSVSVQKQELKNLIKLVCDRQNILYITYNTF